MCCGGWGDEGNPQAQIAYESPMPPHVAEEKITEAVKGNTVKLKFQTLHSLDGAILRAPSSL